MRFLYVDRVVELLPGKRILARKHISLDGMHFSHHFSKRPVFPAPLVIECLAQAAGWLNFVTHGESIRMVVALVENVRFLRPIESGGTLECEARMVYHHPGGATMEGEVRMDGELVATVERIVFANQDVDTSELPAAERRHSEYVRAGTRLEDFVP